MRMPPRVTLGRARVRVRVRVRVRGLRSPQVFHRALIDNVPILTELLHKFGVVAFRVNGITIGIELGGVNDLKVIHVDTYGEGLGACRIIVHEDAAVRIIKLSQTHDFGAPREDFALQASSCLRDAVDRLFHDAYERPARRIVSRSAWWWHAIHHLTFEELTLKVGGNVVDAANLATFASGIGEQPTSRCM